MTLKVTKHSVINDILVPQVWQLVREHSVTNDNASDDQIKNMLYLQKKEGVRRINRFISRLYLALFDAESGRPLNEFSCALYTPVDYRICYC